MNKNKTTYERPTCDLLVIRFEQGILQASLRTNSANSGYDSDNDLDEI